MPGAANKAAGAEAKPKVKPVAGALPIESKEVSDATFNFSNAKLFDVIQQVARLAGLNYTIDPALKDGPVRLFMFGKLETSSLGDVLALALKLNGVSVLRNGDFLEFVPAPSGTAKAGTPLVWGTQPVDDLGDSFQVTQVIPLRFLDAESFSSFAKDFLSTEGRAALDKSRNLLVTVDYLQNIRRVLNFVELLDKQPFDQKRLALFRLKNASPDRVLKELEPLLKAANVPVGTGALQILPLQSLNSLLVITQTAEWIPDLKTWIERFDESPRTEEGELFVLPLRHSKAEALYPLLVGVLRLQGAGALPRPSTTLASTALSPARSFGQSQISTFGPQGFLGGMGTTTSGAGTPPLTQPQPTPAPAPVPPSTATPPASGAGPLSPSASINVDLDNNALVIFGTQRDFAMIQGAVAKLDQMPRQVLIEATIMDLTMTGDFQLGISGFLQEHYKPSDVNVGGAADASYRRDMRVDRPNPDSAFTFTAMIGSKFGLLKAILAVNDTQKNANVISQPRLWALDNRPARLLVQDQIPLPVNTFIPGTGTGTGSSGYSVTNVQYLDTGLGLTVTPHINGSGVIRLEIQQEISSSTSIDTLGSGTSQIQAPRISRRTLSTELIAQSGSTLVLGGLVQQSKSSASHGLPLINRIPVLRHLFSSSSRTNQKSELVILLTPHVVESPNDADRVSEELKARVTRTIGTTWLEKLIPPNPASPKLFGSTPPSQP